MFLPHYMAGYLPLVARSLRRWVAVFFLFTLLLILTASVTLAACGRTVVDPVAGRDTPACGEASQPCRSLAYARERAAECQTTTRIFQIQGNLMTLADVVVPVQATGDHRTPEWLRPVFPFFGLLLKADEYFLPPFQQVP